HALQLASPTHSSSPSPSPFFSSSLPPPPRSPLFPYTTLFRSEGPPQRLPLPPSPPAFVRLVRHDLPRAASGAVAALPPLHQVLRSEEHTSELQSRSDLVCRLLLEKKKNIQISSLSSLIITLTL